MLKILNLDKIHYQFNSIDGYDRLVNFVISGRGSGKTTTAILKKLVKGFNNDRPWIIFRRLQVHVTEEYIRGIEGVINKFSDTPVKFDFKKTGLKSGQVDLFVDGKLFARVLSLSLNLSMLKSFFIKNCGGILFDEFICNRNIGEKYLKDEVFKFFETYSTYVRECDSKLKCYFLGNPYSLYNPYFVKFGITPKNLKLGEIYAPRNELFAVEWFKIDGKLKELIFENNPLLKVDTNYTEYALEGVNVDDKDILLVEKHPRGFKLSKIFFIESQNIAIYENILDPSNELAYWVSTISSDKINREVYCLDIKDLSLNRQVMSIRDLRENRQLARAMRVRHIGFKNIESYYLFLEIYYLL